MPDSLVPYVRLVALALILGATSLSQSDSQNVRPVISNRDARRAATTVEEATVPPGFSSTEFTVRISVGADGSVKNVSNSHSLPDPLFAAAAEAARKWHFPSDREAKRRGGFEADISFHGPIAGTVTTKDGLPLAGVVVAGSEWTCCPVQQDSAKTDKSGSFRIEHPGEVLHFDPPNGFQPQSVVVTSEMSTLKVTVEAENDRLSLGECSEPERDVERIGWGKYGLHFDVRQRDVRLIRGKADVDYIVHIVKVKQGDDRVEFWFGPYAMGRTPEDKQYVESDTFATRNVVMPAGLVRGSNGGVIGTDTWGRLPNGKVWRQTAIGMEGARYREVSPQDAATFDRIINSACWVPDPNR